MGTTHFKGKIDAAQGFASDGVDVIGAGGKIVTRLVKKTVNWNDTSPVVVAALPAGAVVLEVLCNVRTAFNGTGTTLDIGDAGDADRFLASADIAPSSAGWSRSSKTTAAGAKGHAYATAANVLATIAQGTGASQGVADVYVLFAVPA